jgi:hypothetical protein
LAKILAGSVDAATASSGDAAAVDDGDTAVEAGVEVDAASTVDSAAWGGAGGGCDAGTAL